MLVHHLFHLGFISCISNGECQALHIRAGIPEWKGLAKSGESSGGITSSDLVTPTPLLGCLLQLLKTKDSGACKWG